MANMTWKGLKEYERQLEKLIDANVVRGIASNVVYVGAEVLADQIRNGIGSLPVVANDVHGSDTEKLSGITQTQKDGLDESLGISPLRNEGGRYSRKVGFDGYNATKTRQYPNGQPNALIARAVNSGTSFRQKIPFVDDAIRSARKDAEKAMAEEFDKSIEKVMK